MKKTICSITFICLCVINYLQAQNTFPSTGNVGIGTSSPANLLDVRGTIYTNGTMQVDGGDLYISRVSTAFGYVLRPNVTGYKNLQFAVSGGGPLDNITLNSALSYFTGNVGIGTIAPTTTLDVNGSFHTAYNTQTAAASNAGGGLSVSWNRSNANAEVNLWNVYNGAVTSFQFSQKTGATTYSDLMTLLGNGNVGLSNNNPSTKLDIQTSTSGDGMTLRYSTTGFVKTSANSFAASAWNSLTQSGDAGTIYGGTAAGNGAFGYVIAPWANATTGLRLDNNGNVGIATANTQGYQLAVNGSAIFTKAVVKLYSSWPDYVFKNTYELPSLQYVSQYIKANNHLPEVPSQNEIQKTGIDLGANQTLLLKKIEELTLYIIAQDKEISEMKSRDQKIIELEKRLGALEKQSSNRDTPQKK